MKEQIEAAEHRRKFVTGDIVTKPANRLLGIAAKRCVSFL